MSVEEKTIGGNFTCPRCDMQGYLEKRRKNGHTYHYCIHITKINGKRKVRRCYLGAEKYDYVERFQKLTLTGLTDEQRYIRYLATMMENMTATQLQGIITIAQERLKGLKP
jgi:hypothetical protein